MIGLMKFLLLGLCLHVNVHVDCTADLHEMGQVQVDAIWCHYSNQRSRCLKQEVEEESVNTHYTCENKVFGIGGGIGSYYYMQCQIGGTTIRASISGIICCLRCCINKTQADPLSFPFCEDLNQLTGGRSTPSQGNTWTWPSTCSTGNDGWAAWGAWSDCSVSCGEGVQTRMRDCNFPDSSSLEACPGNFSSTRTCDKGICLVQEILATRAQLGSLAEEIAQLKNNTAQLKSDNVQLRRDNVEQAQEIAHLNTSIKQTGKAGALYTRWGRTTCPSSADLVYAGLVGGGHADHYGGSSQHVCLPKTPQWGRYTSSTHDTALLYGAEYWLPLSRSNYPFSSANSYEYLKHGDVLCAVCLNKDKSTTMMIPARKQCMGDWHLEYQGYLMGSYYYHARNADYLCVDENPEQEWGGWASQNGDVLYTVEVRCGSLSCPPYVNGRELTCVVCTK